MIFMVHIFFAETSSFLCHIREHVLTDDMFSDYLDNSSNPCMFTVSMHWLFW